MAEPLFDNRFVTTGGLGEKRFIFLPGWCENRINQIRHITYEVLPKTLPSEAVRELLTDTSKRVFKQHASILEAIPKDWKYLLNTEIGKPDETFYIRVGTDIESKLVTQLNCKTLYNILLTDDPSSIDHAYRAKWTNTLGPVNWMKIFKNIQKNNFDRKANDLRWKILHRCIPTAKRLAGRSQFFSSSTCKVCGQYEENLTHLCYLCSSAKKT